jgi:hypothetical protein
LANKLYPKFKEGLLSGVFNLATDTVKAVLVDTADYTYSDTHRYLSDVPVAAREEISPALTAKTVTDGVFDADDVTFTGAAGDPCEALVLMKDTGDPATSPLIAYIDTATGLPIILNTGNVNVTWPSGASKIFAL